MANTSHNTTFFPVSSLDVVGLQRRIRAAFMAQPLAESTSPEDRKRRDVLEYLADIIAKQQQYNNALKLALDDTLRLIHQRIDRRASVGLLADRPGPDVDGISYLAVDEIPPTLYVAVDDTWIPFQSV